MDMKGIWVSLDDGPMFLHGWDDQKHDISAGAMLRILGDHASTDSPLQDAAEELERRALLHQMAEIEAQLCEGVPEKELRDWARRVGDAYLHLVVGEPPDVFDP